MKIKKQYLFIFFISAIVLLWANRLAIYRLPAFILIDSTDPTPGADYIALLMGNSATRPFHGANVYKKNPGSFVIISQTPHSRLTRSGYIDDEATLYRKILVDQGVPDSKIITLEKTITSTMEEATGILEFVYKNKPHGAKLKIVTDWYHSSRARWIFNKLDEHGLNIESNYANSFPEKVNHWWQYEGSFISIYTEYLKWVYYVIKY